ncbi:hypothetical protein C3E98_039480, partial [Pseudomonas sp. MWU13-2625]
EGSPGGEGVGALPFDAGRGALGDITLDVVKEGWVWPWGMTAEACWRVLECGGGALAALEGGGPSVVLLNQRCSLSFKGRRP